MHKLRSFQRQVKRLFPLLLLPVFAWGAVPMPTAYWNVNEEGRSGDSCFYEQVNGTLETCSGTTSVDTSGAIDGIDFTGAGYVLVNFAASALSSTDLNSDWTIAVRLRQDTPVPAAQLEWWAGYQDSTTGGTTNVRVGPSTSDDNDTKASWVDGTNSYFFNPSPDQVQDGTVSVVVFRRTNNDISLWKDGVEIVVDNTYTLASITADAFEIGAQNTTNTAQWHFRGTIEWVSVHAGTALSDAQIGELDDVANPYDTGNGVVFNQDTYSPGDTISATATAFTNPMTTATEQVGLDTISAEPGATNTAADFILCGPSGFQTAGACDNTQMGKLLTYQVTDGTSNATDTLTIQPGGGDSFDQMACDPGNAVTNVCDDDSLFYDIPATYDLGDEYYAHVAQGTCTVSDFGVASCSSVPATIELRLFDVSLGAWGDMVEFNISTTGVVTGCQLINPLVKPMIVPMIRSYICE